MKVSMVTVETVPEIILIPTELVFIEYATQKQENYAIVQSKILSAIFNSPTWLKGHFSESL